MSEQMSDQGFLTFWNSAAAAAPFANHRRYQRCRAGDADSSNSLLGGAAQAIAGHHRVGLARCFSGTDRIHPPVPRPAGYVVLIQGEWNRTLAHETLHRNWGENMKRLLIGLAAPMAVCSLIMVHSPDALNARGFSCPDETMGWGVVAEATEGLFRIEHFAHPGDGCSASNMVGSSQPPGGAQGFCYHTPEFWGYVSCDTWVGYTCPEGYNGTPSGFVATTANGLGTESGYLTLWNCNEGGGGMS